MAQLSWRKTGVATFKDHFSDQAAVYAACRPTYPRALADYLFEISPENGLAWEAGCGSGQLSVLLARRFRLVAATDASRQQLAQARRRPNIAYWCAPAESSGLAPGTADLAVAAQAAHWFNLEAYYREARRVAGPGAVLALVTYGNVGLGQNLEPLLDSYRRMIASYWPPERRFVEEGYRSFPFPFEELKTPSLKIETHWTLDQFVGYLRTSSAVQALERRQGQAPMQTFRRRLASVWDPPQEARRVHWPLTIRAGRL